MDKIIKTNRNFIYTKIKETISDIFKILMNKSKVKNMSHLMI